MLNREEILKKYSWLQSDEELYLVMGDDLDSAISTLLFLSKNPKATLIGIYSGYKKIFFNKNVDLEILKNAVYIDLDIYMKPEKSLGHHIVRINKENRIDGFDNSCNINELIGYSLTYNFTHKYPLSTAHFLIWLYEINNYNTQDAETIIWLADSSFINGQKHRFANNVENWLHNIMPNKLLQSTFTKISTLEFEEKVFALQQEMEKNSFNKGQGQIKSFHKKLTGYQCQLADTNNSDYVTNYILKILRFVYTKLKCKITKNQIDIDNLTCISGERKTLKISDIKTNLDDFLLQNNVFSFVFPYKDTINYTILDKKLSEKIN